MVALLYSHRIIDTEAGMLPASHVSYYLVVYLEGVEQQLEHPFLPVFQGAVLVDIWDVNKVSGLCENSFRYDSVNVRMKMDKIAERLHCPNHGRHSIAAVNFKPENVADGLIRCPAELAEKFTVVAKKNSQPFRNGKNPLPMRHICQYLNFQAMRKQKGAFLVAGRATRTLTT